MIRFCFAPADFSSRPSASDKSSKQLVQELGIRLINPSQFRGEIRSDLNDGEAPFPEHHMVYIDPISWDHYTATGEFREGTVIAKELTLVRAPDGANDDGSTDEISGTGYFMGEYSGFEITIKSEELYPDEPGNWAYYTFGHQPEPYNTTAMRQPAEECSSCHEAAAAEDFVFTQFYPVLRSAKPD